MVNLKKRGLSATSHPSPDSAPFLDSHLDPEDGPTHSDGWPSTMRALGPRTLVWRRLGAPFLLLILAGLASPMALADCGHDGRSAPGIEYFEKLTEAGALGTPPEPVPIDSPELPPACPGGVCARDPAVPTTPSFSTSSRNFHWAWLVKQFLSSGSTPFSQPFPDEVARPIRLVSPLFRPPRLP